MTVYKKSGPPTPFITERNRIRKLDEDLIRFLGELDDNLDALLNTGLNYEHNFDAVYVTYTTNATPDTQDTVVHGLGRAPVGFHVVDRDKAGIIYRSGASTATNLLLKCNVASVTVKLLVF